MSERNSVDDWVYQLRGLPIDRFYLTAPVKATGLPAGEVWRQLLLIAQLGWIRLAYEVRCDNCGTIQKTEEVADPTTLYALNFVCHFCGEETEEVTAASIFPVFLVDGDWSRPEQGGSKKALAASGRVRLPTGGEVTLEGANDVGVEWQDLLLGPEKSREFRELLREIRPGLDRQTRKRIDALEESLRRIPKDKNERNSKLLVIVGVFQFLNAVDDFAAGPTMTAIKKFASNIWEVLKENLF